MNAKIKAKQLIWKHRDSALTQATMIYNWSPQNRQWYWDLVIQEIENVQLNE